MAQAQQEEDRHPTPDDDDQYYPTHESFYELGSQIGGSSSAAATVFKATCLTNSSPVAIKIINLDKSKPQLGSDQFTLLHTFLDHPNLLKPHCSFVVKNPNRVWVVMPYISGGSLQFTGGQNEPTIAIVLERLLHALFYIHGQGQFHGDVKSGNILFDEKGSVKLGDLGYSVSVYGSSEESRVPYWSAPEVMVEGSLCSPESSDIWSFGIAALEMVHGRPPVSHRFYDDSFEETEFGTYRKWLIKSFSKSFRDMVGLCLNRDPSKRPSSAGRLLDHQFFKNCKGADFLVPNSVEGLPDIEKRFRMIKIEENGDKLTKQRRIVGWEFNAEDLELDPVFEGGGKRVSRGDGKGNGELSDGKSPQDDTDKDSSEKTFNASGGSTAAAGYDGGETLATDGGDPDKKEMLDKNLDTDENNKKVSMEFLMALSKNLGLHLQLIILHNHQGVELNAIFGEMSSLDLEPMKQMVALRTELENQKKMMFELETSLQSLKLARMDKNLVAGEGSGEKSGNAGGGSARGGGGGLNSMAFCRGGFNKKEWMEFLMVGDKNVDLHKQLVDLHRQQIAKLGAIVVGEMDSPDFELRTELENQKKMMFELEKLLQYLKLARMGKNSKK